LPEPNAPSLSVHEARYWADICARDDALRRILNSRGIADCPDIQGYFAYLTEIKDALGNVNNSIGFVATLLAKDYLVGRFGALEFDAAAKAQGAPGPDIELKTADGKLVRCEIKTTKPYQPGFGANQKKEILKDLKKLTECVANFRFMMVTNQDAFLTLCKPSYAATMKSVEIVNLLTKESYTHGKSNSF